MFSRFDTIPACDGRTDRQTDVQPVSITCFSIADARKNGFPSFLTKVTSLATVDGSSEVDEVEHAIKSQYNSQSFSLAVELCVGVL